MEEEEEEEEAVSLALNAKVLVEGLVKATELNGCRGRVVAAPTTDDRWGVAVRLDTQKQKEVRKRIRAANLRPHPDWSVLSTKLEKGTSDEEERRGVLANSLLTTTNTRSNLFRFLAFSIVNTYAPIDVDSARDLRGTLLGEGYSPLDAELAMHALEGDYVIKGGVAPVPPQDAVRAGPDDLEYDLTPGHKLFDARKFRDAKRLVALRLPYVVRISNLCPVLRDMRELKVLDLGGSPGALDGEALLALASICPLLEQLSLGHDNKFIDFLDANASHVDRFVRAKPHLRFFHLLQRLQNGLAPNDTQIQAILRDAGLFLREIPDRDRHLASMSSRVIHYWRQETEEGWSSMYYAKPDFRDYYEYRHTRAAQQSSPFDDDDDDDDDQSMLPPEPMDEDL